ncbi:helix-turn-helix transcriptional regulator [Novosphingobium terrae]|uniref:helix-turn-helix transcriptional regulator n=1 Tax=Novosphingobium terrae TaxID=2726189 RepID=UPI00197D727D|nr:AraC family transcriptional regulator [Novosphingobium terrae]
MFPATALSHQPPIRYTPLQRSAPAAQPQRSRRWSTPPGTQLVSIERRQWTRVEAVVRSLRCDQPLTMDLRADRPQLVFVLEQVGGHLDIRSAPHEASPSGVRGPHFSILPAGADAWACSEKLSFVRGMTLQFDADIAEEGLDIERAFALRIMNRDERLLRLANLLAEECTVTGSRDRVFEDSLTLALLSSLAHLPGPRKKVSRGGLAPWQLKRVSEFLFENMGESLRLEQLASLTQLSLSHFCRSFKATTGLAPHQWILEARINKARELLLKPQARLADVALETGFSDQAHFTRAFGRAVGQSPGAWQRSRNA